MRQVVEFSVAITEVAVDASMADGVAGIVGVSHGKSLEDSELHFDQVEPGGLGWGPHRVDAQTFQQRQETRVIVDVVQVVKNHEQTLPLVASPQTAEGFGNFHNSLATTKDASHDVGVHIVEAEKMLDPLQPTIRRANSLRLLLPGPSDAADGLEFQRTPLVETDYGTARWTAPIERPDAFFLRSKAGSVEVFQVRTRWALSPSRRSKRRTHSSVTGGNNFRRRQYSASLATDQTENGRPRSAGLDSATSTSSRS